MRHQMGADAAYGHAMALVAGTPAFQNLVRNIQAGGSPEIVGYGGWGRHQLGQDGGCPPPPSCTPPMQTTACPVYAGGPGAAYGGVSRVVDRPLTDIREFVLGFFQSGIASGAELPIISRPQVVFRGERLVVPSTVSGNFSIVDIKVGNRSQLVNSQQLPAQMFIETAVGVRLTMDTAAVAQDVAIVIINTSNTNVTFQASIVGTAAQ